MATVNVIAGGVGSQWNSGAFGQGDYGNSAVVTVIPSGGAAPLLDGAHLMEEDDKDLAIPAHDPNRQNTVGGKRATFTT